MFERFNTFAKVAMQVIRGRAFVETLHPKKRNHIKMEIFRDGKLVATHEGWNSRVDAGASWQAQLMGSAAGTPAAYMALSATVLTPAKGDTTLSGEILSGANAGCARALAAYGSYVAPSSLNGAASYQLTKTFTSSASQTVNSAALFNASSAGSMFVEANLSSTATLATNDQIALTWTINI